jgi:division protein CdvB (Snf7/Vps24/ESCRT-III family)
MLLRVLESTECRIASEAESVAEEGSMEGQRSGDALADLTEAAAIQDELVQQRLALEWVKTILERLLQSWMQLETHEAIAYEDKVQSQVNLLTEATGSLTHLHKTLGHFSHQLKDHQRHLNQTSDPFGR